MQLPNCYYRVSIKGLILNKTRDKFLICREETDFWELPGGGLEHGLTPQEDLPREIAEEMGLKTTWVAKNPSYFLSGEQTSNAEIKIVNVIYECTVEDLNITPSDECTEIAFINAETEKNSGRKLFIGVEKLLDMLDPKNHQTF